MKLTKYEQMALKPLLRRLFQGPMNKKQISKEFFDNTNLIQLSDQYLQFESIPQNDDTILIKIKEIQKEIQASSEPDLIQKLILAKEKLENNSRLYHLTDYLDEVILLALVKSGLRIGNQPNNILHYKGVSIVDGPSYDIKAALA